MEPMAQRRWLLLCFAMGISPFLINGALNPILVERLILYWLFEIASWVFLPLLLFAIANRKAGLRLAHLGLHAEVRGSKRPLLLFLLCVVSGPLYLFIYTESLEVFRQYVPGEALFAYQSVVPPGGISRVIVGLYLAVTAGVVEELYFRGLFHRIAESFPAPAAVYLMFSPTLFALVHWEGTPAAIPATFVIGLVASVAFLAARNLWPLIVAHVYADFLWYL